MKKNAGSVNSRLIVLIMAIIVLTTLAGLFVLRSARASKAKETLDQALAKTGKQEMVTYGDVSVAWLGTRTTISDLVIDAPDGGDIQVDKVVLSELSAEKNLPEDFSVSMKGIHIPVDKETLNQAAEPLAKMGLENLLADFNLDYNYDRENKSLKLKTLSLGIKDLGEATLSMNITGFDPSVLILHLMNPTGITVSEVTLEYKDSSLVDKLLTVAAEEKGGDKEAMKGMMLALLEAEQKKAEAEEDGVRAEALKAVMEFVENPKSLRVSIKPEEPLPLSEIMAITPGNIPENLNLEIKAN